MRAEPGEGRGSGRGITEPHADAAHDTEADDQAGITFAHAGNDTAHRQKQAAQDGAELGADFVLNLAAGNHEYGENKDAEGKRRGGLGIGQIRPTGINPVHDGAG